MRQRRWFDIVGRTGGAGRTGRASTAAQGDGRWRRCSCVTVLSTDPGTVGVHPREVLDLDPGATPALLEGRRELETALRAALEADLHVGTTTGLLLVGGVSSPALVRRMHAAVRAGDRWTALPGELHAVLLTGLPPAGSEGVVDRAADALLHAVESCPRSGGEVRVSIGASLGPGRAGTAEEAIGQALLALGSARRAGGRCARIRPV